VHGSSMLLTHHTDTLNTYLVDATHDSVLMLPFSYSHRPGVCITRPKCKARSDVEEGRGGEGAS